LCSSRSLAEETEAIVGMGEWALRTACRDAAAGKIPGTVAVNLSPVQFGHDDLAETIHAILLERCCCCDRRTVLALGESLGMPVLAEGIETDAQWQFLDRAGGGVGGAPLDFLHRSLSREICPNIVGRVTLLPFEASISQQGRMGMADNKKKRGGADRGLIALSEPYEVAYWSKKFKITPAKLKAAVKKVGRSAKKVEAYIKLQAHKAADRARIAMSQPYEVSYWSKKFKVTPARLKAAVAAVGHSSKAVGAYLAKDKGAKKAKKAAAKTPRKTAKKRAKKAA
jgi:hypothetical protein